MPYRNQANAPRARLTKGVRININIINFFAKLFYALNYQYDSLPNYDIKILLFLGVPDIFLHPDWQKKYINILINFLNTNYSQYKFHIIITSHSPIILSDLPKENVIYLEK